MSLVVVRKSDSGIIFVADSALFHPNDEKMPSMLEPQLKVTFPFPEVCLGFAGLVDFAIRATELVLKLESFDLKKVLDILVTQNKASANQTDFILATSDGNRIYEIKNRQWSEVEASWVGDGIGFRKFQELFHGMNDSDPLVLRLSDAMKGVIDDKSIKDVDGLVVRCDNRDGDGKFRYQISVEMYGGFEPILIPSGEPTILNFGGASSGAHKIDIFHCSGVAGYTLGLYYEIGEFGFVWAKPGKIDTPAKITNVSRAEFVHQTKNTLRLDPAVGLSWTDYRRAAIKNLSAGENSSAEFYCSEGMACHAPGAYIPDQHIYYELFFLKAQALARQGKLREAEESMNKAIVLSENVAELHFYLGLILVDLSEFARALTSLSRAIDIDSTCAPAYLWRGNIKRDLGIDDFGKSDFEMNIMLIGK